MNPKIYIIILNWNGYSDTVEAIKSLLDVKSEFNIVVVDNDSINNESSRLKKLFMDSIEVIKLKSNIGFAGGNNVGIKYALENGADLIMLLNNDTIVEADFLSPLLDKLRQNTYAGIVSPMIFYNHNRSKIWSAGGKIHKLRSSGFTIKDNLNIEKLENTPVTFVSGCCMLIKKEVFQKIGLLDEKYFLYLEDTDFCFRTVNAGFGIYTVPLSKIYHKVSGSTRNFAALPLYYSTRNRLFFAKKNFGSFFLFPFLYLSLVMILKGIVWTFTGQFFNTKILWLSFKDFFSNQMGKANHIDFKKFV